MQEEKINLAGINSIEEFAYYAEANILFPDIYPVIKNDGVIIEFLLRTNGTYGMVIYNPEHTFYKQAFDRARVSENTYIEGV